MIHEQYLAVLRKIHERLKYSNIEWVITGSLGMALQGMDLEVHDIDIQTDEAGAYEIENKFPEYVITPVHYSPSERVSSHLGKLEIDGVEVEIMGAIQKRVDQIWEEPVSVGNYRNWVKIEGMQIPVLSLEYEYRAYLKLGRIERAQLMKEWLQNRKRN